MARALSVIAVVFLGASIHADAPPTLADLVKQLGDPKFAVREKAQRELLKRDEGIAPELEMLARGADPETVERIGKVRYALVGYKDDIKRLLADIHDGKDRTPMPVSDELRRLIAAHQPGAGDFLLSILANSKHELHRQSLRTFIATWDVATADQIDAYVQKAVTLNATHRPKFPAKVGAMISFEAQLRDGWAGWPNQAPKTFIFKTRTTRYLDGKPYDKPFDYPYPFATIGWYRVGELAEGKHTIHAVMEYEFTQRGEKRKGELRSKDSVFEVVSADTPDELVGQKTVALSKKLHTAFVIAETEDNVFLPSRGPVATGIEKADPWYPQVGWMIGEWHLYLGLHVPRWQIIEKLDEDLCFDVKMVVVKTGKAYPCDPLFVRSGETGSGWLGPKDAKAFCVGREGFVPVKFVLSPSRVQALSDPQVRRYFAETITTRELRLKVYPPAEEEKLPK